MPEGYKDAVRVFDKILKPPLSYLREQGLSSVVYVDDTLLGSEAFLEYKHNVTTKTYQLRGFSFFIHPDKSIFTPTQDILYLGFHIKTQVLGSKYQRCIHFLLKYCCFI